MGESHAVRATVLIRMEDHRYTFFFKTLFTYLTERETQRERRNTSRGGV